MSYFDLGRYSRKITTSSADAQLWFDRGLNWVFGFNHTEAIKCFQKALTHDPDCAETISKHSHQRGLNLGEATHGPTLSTISAIRRSSGGGIASPSTTRAARQSVSGTSGQRLGSPRGTSLEGTP